MNPAGTIRIDIRAYLRLRAEMKAGGEAYMRRLYENDWEETVRWWNPEQPIPIPPKPNAVKEMIYYGPDLSWSEPPDHRSAFLRAVEKAKLRYGEAQRFVVRIGQEAAIIPDGERTRTILTAGFPPGTYVFRSFGDHGYEIRNAAGRVIVRDEYVTVDLAEIMRRDREAQR